MLQKGAEIRCLKLIANPIGYIFSLENMRSFQFKELQIAMGSLRAKGLINPRSFFSAPSLTDSGRDFLKEYDQTNNNIIFDGNFHFAVLKFLFEFQEEIEYIDFPKNLISHAPRIEVIPERSLEHYLRNHPEISQYISWRDTCCQINIVGIARYNQLESEVLTTSRGDLSNATGKISNMTVINNNSNKEAFEKKQRPLVFIGSAAESIPVVNALASNLDHTCECIPWHADIFGIGEYAMESLIKVLKTKQPDFAIFVLSGADKIESRGEEYRGPRDNVVFELGLAMGALSRERVFMLVEEGYPIKLPSDLFGINPAKYRSPDRGSLNTALLRACTQINSKIAELGLLYDK